MAPRRQGPPTLTPLSAQVNRTAAQVGGEARVETLEVTCADADGRTTTTTAIVMMHVTAYLIAPTALAVVRGNRCAGNGTSARREMTESLTDEIATNSDSTPSMIRMSDLGVP